MLKNFKNLKLSEIEEEILRFWQENKIFEKSVKKPKAFIFYDGPPFATGLPHYGHILASTVKDAVGRYWTMKGFSVSRRWGWDCHGLPIENIVEKDLNISGKDKIEEIGIDKFNACARDKVFGCVDDWKQTVERMGRWVDFDGSYKTLDNDYIESVWWGLKKIYDKGLLYEGMRVLPYCPRCETPVSNSEIAMDNSYKIITDISVIVKFELVDEPGTFILAWTTTPWTLPGNAALAVNNDFDYVKIRLTTNDQQLTTENFILAKDRLEILGDKEYKIIETFKGKNLIGQKYKPLFDYYADEHNNNNKVWKIYATDFVLIKDGTGVVHIAPAFGEDDLNLAKKENLPIIHHIDGKGKFKKEVIDFVGKSVKPKENHQTIDIEIIKYLFGKNFLFAKKKIEHSYPHCHRCATPLYYYAISSWFINIQKIKNRILDLNKKINWIPFHLKFGRFKNITESAPDWNISRSRYWASPLPIWKCEDCGNLKIIGSIEDIKKNTKKSGNKYFIVRHGMAESNVKNIISTKLETSLKHPLVKKGKEKVKQTALKLKSENIGLIFASDFLRTRMTAEIIAEQIGYDKDKIIFDERLREINTGIFDDKNLEEYNDYFSSLLEKFEKNPPEGENLIELKNRVGEFLYEINEKYSGENILIVSHEYTTWLLFACAKGLNSQEAVEFKSEKPDFIETGEARRLNFIPLPHDKNYVLDLHRPYIDEVKFECQKCQKEIKRIPEVFDCWFESASMPYASNHYPFENLDKFNPKKRIRFPADFIAEYVAQTRTWFYYMLVVSTILFDEISFKNVITTGNIMAEDGKKMSKSLKNYPDPNLLFDKCGADALRYYLLDSPLMRSEDINFFEKGVDEVYKKVIMRLWNVLSFYNLYDDRSVAHGQRPTIKSVNVLDRWICVRLNQLIKEVSFAMNNYELDKATRPISEFVDDLSTWYIRRSRERFKLEKNNAINTTKFVLLEFSKIIAPFMPFIAEAIYQSLQEGREKRGEERKSVHLEGWPKSESLINRFFEKLFRYEKKILNEMREVRRIVSLGLEARAEAGIKIRQPLALLSIKHQVSSIKHQEELLELIKDEVNVKEVIFNNKIENKVELILELTPELIQEGQLRELTRAVQDLRKKTGLTQSQKISLEIQTSYDGKEFIKKFEDNFKKSINAESIEFKDFLEAGNEIKVGDLIFSVEIKLE